MYVQNFLVSLRLFVYYSKKWETANPLRSPATHKGTGSLPQVRKNVSAIHISTGCSAPGAKTCIWKTYGKKTGTT